MSESCEQCKRFRSSRGLLVRAFECEGNWSSMPADNLRGEDDVPNLPIERFGPGHDSSFYPPAYGGRLLALARSRPHDKRLEHFRRCAQREVSPIILQRGPWRGTAGPRPTTLLQGDITNMQYATYANSFGFTLRSSSTRVVGAHAFDAWTTKQKPPCENEDQQATLRMQVVRRFCLNASTVSDPKNGDVYLMGDQGDQGDQLRGWPAHVALSRMLASSSANCRFKSPQAMLRQQKLYLAKLRASGLLEHCAFALHAGAISQLASIYNTSDVTGIFVLDWVPSHLPLAALAFRLLPPWLNTSRSPLRLIRLSRTRTRGAQKVDGTQENYEQIACSCHRLPSASTASLIQEAMESRLAATATTTAATALPIGTTAPAHNRTPSGPAFPVKWLAPLLPTDWLSFLSWRWA